LMILNEDIRTNPGLHSREGFESSIYKNFWPPAFTGATPMKNTFEIC
jgi:hypothetical protein